MLCAVKEKTAILKELMELKQVRDELTQEMTERLGDLEKERSKVHGLKSEIDKLKVCYSISSQNVT